MTPEQWLTPTLAAAYPGFVWIVRLLSVIAAAEIVGAVGLSLVMTRTTPRLDPVAAAGVHDVARRFAKARAAILIVALSTLVLWVVGSVLFGLSAERNELLLVVVLGLVGAPAYAMMSILSSAMRRTADITGRGGSLRKD
ncbi:MAG: hypothetical protein DME13_27075 [Candidatus Rokuibacteriota bacterium]|nr:MAG: hypothetical protein DME13_27075 [Candidatus Rokubacteria bacterium]